MPSSKPPFTARDRLDARRLRVGLAVVLLGSVEHASGRPTRTRLTEDSVFAKALIDSPKNVD
jgi:hypothetical protein